MSLFEWWGESWNPGGTGGVEVRGDRIGTVWLGFTLVRFALTLAATVALPLAVTFWGGGMNPVGGLAAGGGWLLYLALGYFVRPEPDMSNLGLFGGLIDHPFRWSDDLNRSLLFFKLALFPGYFLARPVAEVFYWLAGEAEEV
ncbi:MAG: hypothetical protein H6735_31110 [Alphaproteobacteria bacterium]|nr:hypothetical protein [Alphaproteobacteria bacterium]